VLSFRELKRLITSLLLISAGSFAAERPQVPDCFKVHALIKMDEEHYWANWTNACPYVIDSVYVMVKFADKYRNRLGNGVWGLHFVGSGEHRITRFTAPLTKPEFDSVNVDKITTDSAEALHETPGPPRPQLAIHVEPAPVAVLPAVLPTVKADSVADHHKRGREWIEKRNYHEAVEELSEAIRERPDFPLAYNARGFAYYMSRDYPRSLSDLDEAIRLNPKYLNAYQNRSRSRKAAGDLAGSLADAKKARTLR
jgi:tetratricopeptide (TPR) repeat protein